MNMFEMIESFPSQIKNQHNSLLDFQFDLSNYKDINNAMATAKKLNVPLQVTANLQQVLNSLIQSGKGKKDHSAILHYVETLAGLEVSK